MGGQRRARPTPPMIQNRGRLGAGEATLPRALHRAPRQKTLRHIPHFTYNPAVEPDLRLGLPQHTSDSGLGGRNILDPPTPLTSPTATHYLKPNHKPRFLSLDPNKLIHPTGCNCAQWAVHTQQSHAHTPKVSLNAPYTSRVIGKPKTYSHRAYLNHIRQKFKLYPTFNPTRHTKPIQRTHSFTPLHSRRLPPYGTAVRRGRTEQSDEVASNLIHPQPKIVNGKPHTPFIMQVEGHPTNTSTTQIGNPKVATPPSNLTSLPGKLVTSIKKPHTIQQPQPIRTSFRVARTKYSPLITTPPSNLTYHSDTLDSSITKTPPTKQPLPTKSSFVDARKRINWERLSPRHFFLASPAPTNLKQRHTWQDLMTHTHADRKRLCKRWRYIINRRRHSPILEH